MAISLLMLFFLLSATALPSLRMEPQDLLPGAEPTSGAGQGLFQNRAQLDVATVLMLLGEATIWKTIWGRFRSNHFRWRQFVFVISPGWIPLAGTLFAAMNGSIGPPNLIFDRPPEGSMDSGLFLTNLNSGANHAVSNTILQNIWQTWNRGPRKHDRKKEQKQSRGQGSPFNLTREVGIVDVNLDALLLENMTTFWLQLICLISQITGSLVVAFLGHSFETFLVLILTLIGQFMLLVSIWPRHEARFKNTSGHRPDAVMVHQGFDSMGVLFVRKAVINGREISLEEICWDSQSTRNFLDEFKVITAGLSFLVLVIQIILVGWMSPESRRYYFALGALGLLANSIEAASQPKWLKTFRLAFKGNPHCASPKGSLMSAVAVFIVG